MAGFAAVALQSAPAAADPYRFITLDLSSLAPFPDGVTSATANGISPGSINTSGEIVGTYSSGDGTQGFTYSGGTFTPLSAPPPTTTPATLTYSTNGNGVNDSGLVTGTVNYVVTGVSSTYNGFQYSSGSSTFGPNLGVYIDPSHSYIGQTQAQGVNNAGTIVGYVTDSAGNNHGFTAAIGDTPKLVDVKSGDVSSSTPITSTIVKGINTTGVIVGTYVNASGTLGFVESGGTFTKINLSGKIAGAVNTYVNGINDKGQIVGDYTDGSGVVHGFVGSYLTGSYTTVDYSGAANTFINGIDNFGDIVGNYAALPTDLNSSAFVGDFVPEPFSALLFGSGLVGLAAVRRRKRAPCGIG